MRSALVMKKVFGKRFLPVFLCTIYLVSFSLFVRPVQTQTSTLIYVYGIVIDSKTGQPIPDAQIIFTSSISRKWSVVVEARTNTSGIYEARVAAREFYVVYAYCNLTSTPGFDYVPAYTQISPEGGALNVSFVLLPGASVYLLGDTSLLGSEPMRSVFTVIEPSGILYETNSITDYTSLTYSLLGLDSRTIVVPSNTFVNIKVDITYQITKLHLAITPEDGDLNLAQGSKFTFNLRNLVVQNGVDFTQSQLHSIQAMVEEAENIGFYLSYEKVRLERAENLMEAVQSTQLEGNYDRIHADSHEAYLILRDMEDSLLNMYVDASNSVFFITPFLSVTTVILAFVISESKQRRLYLSLFFYCGLSGLLYLLYPGYNALQKRIYDLWANPFLKFFIPTVLFAASFITTCFIILKFPKLKEETTIKSLSLLGAIVATFSLAARNLMRRRTRTLLTSILMLVTIFAFIILTSFSLEYGFSVNKLPGSSPSEGFLLRKPLTDESLPFKPVEEKINQWLQDQSETTLVVPLVENIPEIGVDEPPDYLAVISAYGSGLTFKISGVLGVYPSLETKVTRIDTIIVQGRFLNDNDVNGILLSEKAAGELQVEPNDFLSLYDRDFIVIGIFDKGKLDVLKDLDGQPISPQYSVMIIVEGAPPVYNFFYIPGDEVVIMHGETAQNLPEMTVSRINVQIESPQEIVEVARLAVLTWPEVETFTSVAETIQRLFIGSNSTISGFSSMIVPLILVVLNVGVTMLGTVYERKREMTIMACVGLTPIHVAAIFVAEALVMGIVAGSLGYILGLMGYRFMVFFVVPLGVKQKVEAVWGILALCFSIASGVLGSYLPALKASTITTPSLLRKFVITSKEKPKKSGEEWHLNMPIQIRKEDLGGFFSFIYERLQEYAFLSMERIEDLNFSPRLPLISFTYIYSEEQIFTENQIRSIQKELPNRYDIQLTSRTWQGSTIRDKTAIHRTARFIRRIILQYGYEHGKQLSNLEKKS